MLAIATLLAALLLSLVITRIATVALTVTGLSREAARFQARSAFTGVGFTTREAESVVGHPVRRRVILVLMLLGNAGLVTIVASLLISFSRAEGAGQAWNRVALLLGGLGAILFLAKSRAVDKMMTRLITALLHRFTDLDVRDYAALLQLSSGYGVVELEVNEEHWTAQRSLHDIDLRREGIAVLGIQRKDGRFIGVPNGSTTIHAGDTLILYGHARIIADLGTRKSGPEGDRSHQAAARAHEGMSIASAD